jgi:hypothetical protein
MFLNDERMRKHAQNLQRYSGTYIQQEFSELMEVEDQKTLRLQVLYIMVARSNLKNGSSYEIQKWGSSGTRKMRTRKHVSYKELCYATKAKGISTNILWHICSKQQL